MKLQLLEYHFTICKLQDPGSIDWSAPFCFAAKTDEECSLVCPDTSVPKGCLACEHGWRAVRITGVLDFSLVGILSRISNILAAHNIPIFAVSTYNTDYVMLKEERLSEAMDVLQANGYEITK